MGFTGFKMGSVNDALTAAAGPAGGVTKMENGDIFAVDMLFDAAPRLAIGPRVEFIIPNQGEATRIIDSQDAVFVKQDESLMPVMIGGKYILKDWQNGVELNAKVFGGLGFGYSTVKTVNVSGDFETWVRSSYSGTGPVADLILGANFMISPFSDIALDLGYRFADMGNMGGPVDVDFSGAFFNLGINYRFGQFYYY